MSLIETYIKEQPIEIQEKLYEIYNIIKEVIPVETTERLSWGMATFYLNGNLVHFAAEKKHIGFHPGASGIENFKDKFNELKYSKGTVQFRYENPLPKTLIQEIVKFRVKEQQSK